MKKLLIIPLSFMLLFAINANAESNNDRLKGKILLQVEKHGEAWYVNPETNQRHFMGRPEDAFLLMNKLGKGISDKDLKKIPIALDGINATDTDKDGLPDFIESFYGSDINKADSDGDGFKDADEVKSGYNPAGKGKLEIDKSFSDKHRGKIFLQVGGKGEAWYINPSDNKRYYLGRPSDAYNIMKKLGLGIKDKELVKITQAKNSLETNNVNEVLLTGLKAQKEIIKFANAEELSTFLKKNHTVSSQYTRGLLYSPLMESNIAFSTDSAQNTLWAGPAAGVSMSKEMSSASSDYSKTNIQVAGVDEADIIKTDGKYIYALSGKTLFIVDAYPANESKVVSKIEFDNHPSNLYLNGDRLAVFGQDYGYHSKALYRSFIRRDSYTFFKIYDLSDKSQPKQIKDLNFEGHYANSRMIGDYVYFITNNYNYGYFENEPVLPRIVDGESALKTSCQELRCYNPDMYYFGIPYTSYNLVSINAINIKDTDESIKGDVYVLESGQEFYVSEKNIYLTYAKYLSEYQIMFEVSKEIITPRLSEANKEKIKKINNTDEEVLNPREKEAKISEIINAYSYALSEAEQTKLQKEVLASTKKKYLDLSKELEKTVIHKIAINKNDLEYKTKSEVTGRVLNQFSMDESSDGYFRIATTKGQTWSMIEDVRNKSYNNLYVLDQDLKVVGSLEGLAEDENIKSVRYMQDRAYMVTFKQIDPLFVIDLSDNKNPKVLGELKIPGWSDYLHPYNDTMLIGLGKDTKENEYGNTVAAGVKLSLFDVSDVTKPIELDSYVIGDTGSYSEAGSNHKAFYFNYDKKLLAFPISISEKKDKEYNEQIFNGAIVFDISDTGFKLKGKISHLSGEDYGIDRYRHDSYISRIMHIEDNFYTLSSSKLGINKIIDLSELKSLTLTEEKKSIDVTPYIDTNQVIE